MVAGKVISLVIMALIAGSLLVSGGLAAYYSAANHTGINAVIMPFVPLGIGLVILAAAFKEAGIKF